MRVLFISRGQEVPSEQNRIELSSIPFDWFDNRTHSKLVLVLEATATSTNELAWIRGRRRSRQNPNLSKEEFLRRQPIRNLLRKLEKTSVKNVFW